MARFRPEPLLPTPDPPCGFAYLLRAAPHLVGGFHSENGQPGVCEQSKLPEHRSLIPINMLMRKLPISEATDRDQRHFHVAIRRMLVPQSLELDTVQRPATLYPSFSKVTATAARLSSPPPPAPGAPRGRE